MKLFNKIGFNKQSKNNQAQQRDQFLNSVNAIGAVASRRRTADLYGGIHTLSIQSERISTLDSKKTLEKNEPSADYRVAV